MSTRRIHRANPKSDSARNRERELRDSIQAQKPSLDDLIHSGDVDANAVISLGQYFDLCEALMALKKERHKRKLSITAIAEASGLDRALISRLENGKIDNPTLGTLNRYAEAIGKRFLWSIRDTVTAN